ncbi:pimeloyl-ACP methyl ester carboxylesterase [Pseudomonas duriflava]|uniref:Pimeloyl-ACP methyl ester carboxylesterase n=1 Tax=Pseudomonas duriflava TaxID=459528 RepID=A0A562QBH4_9PSED|nr:alpha/beta hydrolase [Pseudomonas duriflava]TWI53530.1 pimeloyl-ACP methyl ester carboxylesterase [Pseudomonas duriflava]
MTAHVQELRINLPHIELAAHLFGPEDGQPVLALHGWLDNAMTFSRLAPRLHGLRIVALDLPGHGLSAHRPAGCGYLLQDYVQDVLYAVEQLGWKRFSLLGHSLGAIISVMFASALPERVERLALIDGLMPYTTTPEEAPSKLGNALRAQLNLPNKRKPVYERIEDAVQARLKGVGSVSVEAAELLAERGLMPVPGGYTWRSDARLTLPTTLRLTAAQALAFLKAVKCPAQLIVAEQGLLVNIPGINELLAGLEGFKIEQLPGGHHLHLDDEAGAQAVADCFNRFFV